MSVERQSHLIETARHSRIEQLHEQAERLSQKSKQLHEDFNKEKWEGRKSFHNEEHIGAVQEAGVLLVEEAVRDGDDPTEIRKSLDNWNTMLRGEGRFDEQVSEDELADIAAEAIAAHDWGNIMEDIEINEKGKIKPQYHQGYKSAGAEDRAKLMYEKSVRDRMARGELSESEGKKRISLGCHMIEMTKMKMTLSEEDREIPFQLFMFTVDQVGNAAFREDDVPGLVNEFAHENPDGNFLSLRDMRNFPRNRLKVLIPDASKRESLYQTWGVEEPEEDTTSLDRKISFNELAKTLQLQEKQGELNNMVDLEPEDLGL